VYTASAVGESIQSLIAAGERRIILDLSGVSAVDSSGLGTLVANARSMAQAGGTLSVAGLSARVRKILEVTHLAKYFAIQPVSSPVQEEVGACATGGSTSPRGGD
jgi:anti-sigma B factor antagonist